MRIIITAGGTGGHIIPGLVLYEKFATGANTINFVCGKKDAKNFLSDTKIFYQTITGPRFRRKIFSLENFIFIFKFIISLIQASRIIYNFKPEVVIGMGGYVSFPVVMLACLLKIKTVICEQNSIPGLANRVLSRFVDRVILNFQFSKKYIKQGIVLGNPIRKEIGTVSKKEAIKYYKLNSSKKTILILGGSLGAVSLNSVFASIVPDLKRFNIIWLTGRKDFENIKRRFKQLKIFSYLKDIHYAYAAADLVISRAGGGVLTEIAKVGIPAIFIPYPYATEAHQYYNAKIFADAGAAILLTESELSPQKLKDYIFKIMFSNKIYNKLKLSMKKMAQKNTTERILKEVQKVVGNAYQ